MPGAHIRRGAPQVRPMPQRYGLSELHFLFWNVSGIPHLHTCSHTMPCVQMRVSKHHTGGITPLHVGTTFCASTVGGLTWVVAVFSAEARFGLLSGT